MLFRSILTGTSAGATAARYTITNANGCKSTATYPLQINASSGTPSIGYASGTMNPQRGAPTGGFCVGRTFNVIGTPTGGMWSATGIASITSGGAVTINAVGNGSITYSFANANGCRSSRTMMGTGFVCSSRGAADNNNLAASFDFTMYPNPARNTVLIKADFVTAGGQIIVSNLLGKTVKVQPMSLGNNIIDVSNLSRGVYLVNIVTNEGNKTQKLVVE